MIERVSAMLQHIKAEVTPIEILNRLGARRTVSEGHFTFPFPAFDPAAPITVVLIGEGRNSSG